MEADNWKYWIDIFYDIPILDMGGGPANVRMYFSSLEDALDEFWKLSPNSFLEGFNTTFERRFSIQNAPTTKIIIAGQDGTELDVRVQGEGPGSDGKLPGLYFHFPNGIHDFETKARHSLFDFKGYQSGLSSLLVSHLLDEGKKVLKHSLAYKNRLDRADRWYKDTKVRYSVVLTSRRFGPDPAIPRSVSEMLYQEFFFHNDPMEALKHLLSLDFNRLRADTAWENDQPCFYERAIISHNKHSWIAAELCTVLDRSITIEGDNIFDPGVHVSVGNPYLGGLDWSGFNTRGTHTFQLAEPNTWGLKFIKVPELYKLLRPPEAGKKKKKPPPGKRPKP